MKYITIKEAAQKWKITERAVQQYCKKSKIPGAKSIGKQWLVPIDAEKPVDGRRKAEKKSQNLYKYRFPIFVYSDYYVARSDLTQEETMLLDAQISVLKNNYSHSITECRKLTSDDYPVHIRFGAYSTILYGSIVLGLYSEIMDCINMLNSFCDQNPDNEDYKLLITALKFQYSFDYDDFLNINPNKLSPDALILYQLINIETLIINKENDCNIIENLCNSICCQIKAKGIDPATMILYGVMVLFYQRNGNAEKMNHCIDEVCRIGHDEGFIKLLSKNTSLATEEYRQVLLKYGMDFANKIQTLHQQNIIGFQTIYGTIKGEPFFKDCTPEENEIMLLLSYGFSNKTIAEMKNISSRKISKKIEIIRTRYNIETRKELVNFAKRMYNYKKI